MVIVEKFHLNINLLETGLETGLKVKECVTPVLIIAIIWQIERRRQRRREGFRVSICHEKFLLHLNQGAPPQ